MPINVWLLMLAQCFAMCGAPFIVFVGGIVGADLAPDKSLATAPIAAMVVGTAFGILPVSRLMAHWGRKAVFVGGGLLGGAAGLVGASAMLASSFWGLVLSAAMTGLSLAVVQQYRFAAMESVSPDAAATAASRVLLGGLAAAILGPEIALAGMTWFAAPYLGSFLLLAIVVGSAAVFLSLLSVPALAPAANLPARGRPLRALMRQPVLWAAVGAAAIGYAVMSLIMTATPVSMHGGDGISLDETKRVIQAHIVAMYLPSLISGFLIRRLGHAKMMVSGLIAYGICVVIALQGHTVHHYGLALILLGVGWNFLFVSGTALLPLAHSPAERFRAQGFNDAVVFTSQALAALGAGWLFLRIGWEWLLLCALPLMALQLVCVLWWTSKKSVQPATHSL